MPSRYILGAAAFFAFASTARLPVEHLALGRGRLDLGETTFAQVAAILRALSAPVVHVGDAGDARAQACYALAGSATLYVESGELGGGERVDGFELRAAGAPRAAAEPDVASSCTAIALAPAGVRTDRGVALGLTRKQVEARVGRPARDSAGVSIFEGQESRTAGAYRADAFSFLRVRYRDGRVVALAGGANITD